MSQPQRPLRLEKARQSAVRWLFLLPSLVGLLLLSYYPNLETIRYSLYKWNGSTVLEWRAWGNFIDIFTADPKFWWSFALILILLVANLVKMWPSIFAAIVLHRLKSDRWQYVYRVLFVIPMVIPGLVTLLLWKSFFDANVGIFNGFLNATGMMSVLHWLDSTMPVASTFVSSGLLGTTDQPWWQWLITAPFKVITIGFGGAWGLILAAALLLFATRGWKRAARFWLLLPLALGAALVCWGPELVPLALRTVGIIALITVMVRWLTTTDEYTAIQHGLEIPN